MAQEAKKIKFSDRKTVYSTDKDKHRPTGQDYEVHPVQAEALVKSGKASYTDPTAEDKKAKKA